MEEIDLINILDDLNIQYRRYNHEAVFTCEQSSRLLPDIGGLGTKNLFLCDKPGEKFYLAVFDEHKRLDIKKLGAQLAVKNLHFASPEQLKEKLGLEPGSVTLFAILNDHRQAVQLIIDHDLWGNEIHCHPLVNTATLVIHTDEIQKFLNQKQRPYQLINFPEK